MNVLYQPLLGLLKSLYEIIPGQDFGLAIIALTFLVRVVLFPLSIQALKSQKKFAELQPKIKEIQSRSKDSKEEQLKEVFNLYKKEKISPFSGMLPLLIQLPVLIALWRLFLNPPEIFNPMFLGIIDLRTRSLGLAFFAGLLQFFQAKAATLSPSPILYIFPLFTLGILTSLPSALGLYWATTSALGILEYRLITRKKP